MKPHSSKTVNIPNYKRESGTKLTSSTPDLYQKLKDVEQWIPLEAFNFISKYIEEDISFRIMETASKLNVLAIQEGKLDLFINLKKVNDIRYLNKFFETVNSKLGNSGIFIGCAETLEERRKRLLNKYAKIFSYPYYFLDFIIKRILPKTRVTQGIYFFLTRGENRVFSLSEVLGRLVSCGFKIVEYTEIANRVFFVVKKVSTPNFDMNPSYGPIFSMKRIGKEGKIIKVHKLRTMHPYSEYLQEFMYQNNNMKSGGKFKNDFRVTKWGKLLRKFWLDELPMLMNVFKGELKIVGVRPLSKHYFSLYRAELKNRRIKFKPGLIPPYYVDLPKTLDEIMDSEERYFDQYQKHPFKTDLRYFFKASYNIIIKNARSS